MRLSLSIRKAYATALYLMLQIAVCNAFKANAQDVEPEKFDVVLTLDVEEKQRLRKSGYLKASLPRQYLNRVDSVVLKSANSFHDEPLKLPGDVDRRDKSLMVKVDDSVLEHLEWQPVKMKVYESNFSSVLLEYQSKSTMIEHRPSTIDKDRDSPLIYLRINSGKTLSGYVQNRDSLKLATEFGEIDFPFQSFVGVRFNVTNDDQEVRAVILFENGDVVSGKIDVDAIVLKTIWGDKAFQIHELNSITKTRSVELINPFPSEPNRWITRAEFESEFLKSSNN